MMQTAAESEDGPWPTCDFRGSIRQLIAKRLCSRVPDFTDLNTYVGTSVQFARRILI